MSQPITQLIYNSFTKGKFTGNPAAVVLLNQAEIDDSKLQNIASQNNLSETAFIYPGETGTRTLRWFTPQLEVDLCGHATLASAAAIFHLHDNMEEIKFSTKSGELLCKKEDDQISVELPNQMPDDLPLKSGYRSAFGDELVAAAGFGPNLLIHLKSEDRIAALDSTVLDPRSYGYKGLIVTAKSKNHDFVSRYFALGFGIDEDPFTGSAHSILAPYWAQILNKKTLNAFQASDRGGWAKCQVFPEVVKLNGEVELFSKGQIFV
jgi:PhzF family phenazine biosynthesis protein